MNKGPSIDELVSKETVDKLDYLGWEIDQGADPVQVCEKMLLILVLLNKRLIYIYLLAVFPTG